MIKPAVIGFNWLSQDVGGVSAEALTDQVNILCRFHILHDLATYH